MCIYCNTTNYRKIYENHHGPIPKESNGRSYEIHHHDGNHNNNNPCNLIAITIQEHYDIHFLQKDYYACYLIAIQRMNKTPQEISDIAKLNVLKQIINGKNAFVGSNLQNKRVLEGTHPFLGNGTMQRTIQLKRIASGEHHLLGKNNWKFDHTIYIFTNIKTKETVSMTRNEFCKKYNINHGNLGEVIKGNRKTVSSWKVTI